MWLFASQATTHRCDVILNEVRIRGSGFPGKGRVGCWLEAQGELHAK